jgi:hypothetical protein
MSFILIIAVKLIVLRVIRLSVKHSDCSYVEIQYDEFVLRVVIKPILLIVIIMNAAYADRHSVKCRSNE